MQPHRLLSILVVSLSLSQILTAQPDTLWTRTYGPAGAHLLTSIDQTADGGFIIGGSINAFADTGDYWLLRTDAQGDTIWTRTYGGPGSDLTNSGHLTFDGGYIMAGLGEMWLIKTDASGDTLWTRRSAGPGGDETPWVEQTADSGYVITGNIAGQFSDVGLIKTDSLGVTAWVKTYDAGGDEYGRHVQQTADGGYIVLAEKRVADGKIDVWLLKMDAAGDTLWTSTFALGTNGGGQIVRQTTDGGYAIVGLVSGTLTAVVDSLPRDWLLIKTDNAGTVEWSQTYGTQGDDQPFTMIIPEGGGFLLMGWGHPTDLNYPDLWLLKVDNSGAMIWESFISGSESAAGMDLLEIDAEEYAVVGFNGSFDTGELRGWLLRFGAPVVAVTPTQSTPSDFAFHPAFPNPFNPSTTLNYELPVAAEVSLLIYDLMGREVARLVDRRQEAGYHRVNWNGKATDGREVPTGIYIARIQTAHFNKSIKMVLLK